MVLAKKTCIFYEGIQAGNSGNSVKHCWHYKSPGHFFSCIKGWMKWLKQMLSLWMEGFVWATFLHFAYWTWQFLMIDAYNLKCFTLLLKNFLHTLKSLPYFKCGLLDFLVWSSVTITVKLKFPGFLSAVLCSLWFLYQRDLVVSATNDQLLKVGMKRVDILFK